MISIVLVEDHILVRTGLVSLFSSFPDITIVAEFEDGLSFLSHLDSLGDVDIVLLDIALPGMNGIEILHQLRKKRFGPPVLVLSMYPSKMYAQQAFEAGAQGYLTKSHTADEIYEAIKRVLEGEKIDENSLKEKKSERNALELLSPREKEVFDALCLGKTVKETAFELGVSVKSISTYKTRLMEKLHLDSLQELIQLGITEL